MKLIACAILTLTILQTSFASPASGIDPSELDPQIRPGDDFFAYVNARWIAAHPIPPDRGSWGSFGELWDRNLQSLHEILEGLAADSSALDEDSAKLRTLYRQAMDAGKREKDGARPLAGEFDAIAAVRKPADLPAELARLRRLGAYAGFFIEVDQDEKDSSRYVIRLNQGGVGLPERDYYLISDADSAKVRGEYRGHVARMFSLLGEPAETSARRADAVLAIETKLAEASRTPVQRRDPEANYNPRTMDQLKELTPKFDWAAYFQSLGAPPVRDVVVGQPEFFTRLNELIDGVSIDDWQTYLRWRLISSAAPYLSDAFVQEDFRFYGKVLRGTPALQPAWKRAVHTADDLMGEALGRLYVRDHFGPEARRRMADLVEHLVAAYRERIRTRPWMSDATREQALKKLDAVVRKIGYPERWRDYSKLRIADDSFVQNVFRAHDFELQYHLARLGGPVDRSEWDMSPPTVNAYYEPAMNEIVFPAGILQPPFFDVSADDAVNYGAIGSVIGHELTHGFDDEGCKFDAAGNMKNWWTPQDKRQFDERTARLVKQYDDCVVIDGLHLNGRLTLGENLADLGGVTIAFDAYRRSLGGKPAPVLDGFTGEQRFFIGMARMERGSVRPEQLRVSLRTNPHSPPTFRVDVPLSNVAGFYDAFHLTPADRMYRPPDQRVDVW